MPGTGLGEDCVASSSDPRTVPGQVSDHVAAPGHYREREGVRGVSRDEANEDMDDSGSSPQDRVQSEQILFEFADGEKILIPQEVWKAQEVVKEKKVGLYHVQHDYDL